MHSEQPKQADNKQGEATNDKENQKLIHERLVARASPKVHDPLVPLGHAFIRSSSDNCLHSDDKAAG